MVTQIIKESCYPFMRRQRTTRKSKIDTIVLAGKDYGIKSSRDWAAKGANPGVIGSGREF